MSKPCAHNPDGSDSWCDTCNALEKRGLPRVPVPRQPHPLAWAIGALVSLVLLVLV